ncbi:type 1 glutamine amidotransferase domain-containing protein [Saccharothrix mutabilis subsp. mutabilis]|uniref:Type 1 glutamine amidotransferase domain-containing protein n=1 Tax=Saccharothrix mutabilis subsp. mutabilis TaxID=66855 RepID=A0ABN0TC83_9PSEU
MAKILFVLTGSDHWTLADGTLHPTGFWAEEFAVPHRTFTEAGHTVVVTTPGGVVPTVDRGSLSADANGGQAQADAIAAELANAAALREPLKLEDVDPAGFDAVFYPGGHGPMEDLAVNADSGRLLTRALREGKPLAVLCHAPAALLAAGDAVAGYRLTAFTNEEEKLAGLADKAKWLLQDRLEALGVDFVAGAPFAPNVVVDRNLYTGQNPASSGPLATRMLEVL